MPTPLNGEIGERLSAHDQEFKEIVMGFKRRELTIGQAIANAQSSVEKTIALLSQSGERDAIQAGLDALLGGHVFSGIENYRSQFMNACGFEPNSTFMHRVIKPILAARRLLQNWSEQQRAQLGECPEEPPMTDLEIK